ncbi:MAG: YceD family protein [Pseudomonadota bacterium]|nr:YceD family protein [Pseudomonadota bacterium]
MSKRLPVFVDVGQLLARQGELEGALPLAGMARLREAVLAAPGEARFSLRFAPAPQWRGRIEGWTQAAVSMRCERCLEPVEVALGGPVALYVVDSEQQLEQLARGEEGMVLPEATVKLSDWIEDELVLSLPVAPRHADCTLPAVPTREVVPVEAPENPFAALQRLKDDD